MQQNKISIVLPCLNEADAIPNCIVNLLELERQLHQSSMQLEVLLVDDGSRDGSADLARKLMPQIKIIKHTKTRGYGSALKSGFQQATGAVVSMMDIDNTYHPSDILKLYLKLQNESLDLVIGYRAEDMGGFSSWRLFGNYLMRFFAKWLLNSGDMDICSGMRVMRQPLASELTQVKQDGFSYAIAMLEYAHSKGKKLGQIKIAYSQRLGQSKLNSLIEGVSHISLIFRFWISRILQ